VTIIYYNPLSLRVRRRRGGLNKKKIWKYIVLIQGKPSFRIKGCQTYTLYQY
jgi:hypothetical protein